MDEASVMCGGSGPQSSETVPRATRRRLGEQSRKSPLNKSHSEQIEMY